MENFYDNSILVVDDDTNLQEVVVGILEDSVSKVLVASDGQEALEIIRGNEIDLVVADLEMPQMHGLQMIQEALNIRPGLLFVVLTGFGEREEVRRCIDLGVYGFLDKPINDELLLNIVSRGLDKVNSDKIQSEMLEILLYSFSSEDPKKFQAMSEKNRNRILKGVLGLMKIKLLKSKRD